MGAIKITSQVEPPILKAYSKNEALLRLSFENEDSSKLLWCESEVHVSSPLSLAPDTELSIGKTRIGILKPHSRIDKQVKLYTMANNFPDDYKFSIVLYAYDEEGAIAERAEHTNTVRCVENGKNI
ncbi:MAG: hypothetical protein ACP5UH_00705 [Candidatus Micrarchaeia archaeon]